MSCVEFERLLNDWLDARRPLEPLTAALESPTEAPIETGRRLDDFAGDAAEFETLPALLAHARQCKDCRTLLAGYQRMVVELTPALSAREWCDLSPALHGEKASAGALPMAARVLTELCSPGPIADLGDHRDVAAHRVTSRWYSFAFWGAAAALLLCVGTFAWQSLPGGDSDANVAIDNAPAPTPERSPSTLERNHSHSQNATSPSIANNDPATDPNQPELNEPELNQPELNQPELNQPELNQIVQEVSAHYRALTDDASSSLADVAWLVPEMTPSLSADSASTASSSSETVPGAAPDEASPANRFAQNFRPLTQSTAGTVGSLLSIFGSGATDTHLD